MYVDFSMLRSLWLAMWLPEVDGWLLSSIPHESIQGCLGLLGGGVVTATLFITATHKKTCGVAHQGLLNYSPVHEYLPFKYVLFS